MTDPKISFSLEIAYNALYNFEVHPFIYNKDSAPIRHTINESIPQNTEESPCIQT